jgi:Mg2+/Co2+ transporter CorB
MDSFSLHSLYLLLAVLIAFSAFFSGSETSMMSLNRYRLRHLVKNNHRSAMRTNRLLEHPDRLIGLILLGNNFVNILASSIATLIALRLVGEQGIPLAALLLTLVILIFAEVMPKTLAVMNPEKFAFPASFVLLGLMKALAPAVWLVNQLSNLLLRLFQQPLTANNSQLLSMDELKTVVHEAGSLIPRNHQEMLISVLDLEKVVVEDIMIPRTDIIGIDINDSPTLIARKLNTIQYNRIPVYQNSIDQILGFLHMRNTATLLTQGEIDKKQLMKSLSPTYFVPETTPLMTQLINFRKDRQRTGLVVNEYGDIQGLIAMENILEEIVGEFTTDFSDLMQEIHPQDDGSYLIDCSIHIRELNRILKWQFPTTGPKTLNGLLLELLEDIPTSGTSLKIVNHYIEIIHSTHNAIKTVRIHQRSPL